MELRPQWAEVWPLAADADGIWLISGSDAWRSDLPVWSDRTNQEHIQLELMHHHVDEQTVLLHGTSWREDGPHTIHTFVAVVDINTRHDEPPETCPRCESRLVRKAPTSDAGVGARWVCEVCGFSDKDRRHDRVPDHWPDAQPVMAAIVDAVGKPPRHDPVDPGGSIRHIDVLMHAVRHVRHLQLYDTDSAAALPSAWDQHLADLEPTLAGLYRQAG